MLAAQPLRQAGGQRELAFLPQRPAGAEIRPHIDAGAADALTAVRGLDRQAEGRAPQLFIQVNTGAEPQKAGVLPQDADAFLAACRDRYGLSVSGLMCIPPADEAPAPHFALTAQIARRNGIGLLSMGMSADFAIAIAFGATHVRVGTAIFGSRTTSEHAAAK